MTTITYAIGDIHGRLDLLDDLLAQIEAHAAARRADAKIVFTGDYVDRGPASFGVVERLIAGPRRPGDRFVCLRGNHDDLFSRIARGDADVPRWVEILFSHTVLSYGPDPERTDGRDPNLKRHIEFLMGLPLTHDDETNLFVHAGIRPGVALEEQIDQDLIWIRDDFLGYGGPLPRRVVHGHTIMGDDPVVTANRVSIDTGAFRSGRLTAAVFERDRLSFLQAIGEPDRHAMVREFLLEAEVHGRIVTAATRAAYDDYAAGRIDGVGLADLTRSAAA